MVISFKKLLAPPFLEGQKKVWGIVLCVFENAW